ncbi:hypothetical protein [Ensifer adhaerens]|uniref:hypothetical protein n=1 Tax=Ensifer adhaerens TaxID=106592 RepID=UPI001C4E10B7|nr:hypothetical protein [Ensifer adhaerens]MBW0366134.1 hypothetical protein [Ensifer adhaerens]UCM19971.1 hypothetical protein LDL63_19545 [Ensifer adhaerens]
MTRSLVRSVAVLALAALPASAGSILDAMVPPADALRVEFVTPDTSPADRWNLLCKRRDAFLLSWRAFDRRAAALKYIVLSDFGLARPLLTVGWRTWKGRQKCRSFRFSHRRIPVLSSHVLVRDDPAEPVSCKVYFKLCYQ